jgi:hypothetical protein
VRGVAYALGLAWRRARRRGSGAVVAALGIAVGTAVIVGVLAGTTVAQDRSAALALDRIPADGRSLRASWFGVPAGPQELQPRLDPVVREALAGVPLPGPTPIVLFRESTVAGRFAGIAGVDGLAPHVILRSGGLPERCTPRRCEVLRLRGEGALPDAPGLRLVQVGTATLRSRQLFGDFLEPTDNATADAEVAPALRESGGYHRPRPGPLVVADGIAALEAAPALRDTYRSYSWVWPLAAGAPRLWEIGALLGQADRARVALGGISPSFNVAAPVEELRAAERSASVAGRRLLLVGGEAAALLVAFAVLAAGSMRRDVDAARRRLTWYGARRIHLLALTGAEAAIVALGGVVVGWAAGALAGGIVASAADAPVGSVLRESVLAPAGLGLVALMAAVATTLIVLAVSAPRRQGRGPGLIDLAAAVAAVVAAAAVLGGAVSDERLASDDGAALLLLALPGLVSFAAAVAAARIFAPCARLAASRARGDVGLRLAAVSLGRGPGAAALTVAFLTLALSLAVLAEGYRSTLARGEREQAAFRVPLDVVVREDFRSLTPVLDAAPLHRFAALGPGVGAYPVLRATGDVGRTERITGVTVLGLPAATLPRLRVWRGGWADASRAELAARIAPAGDTELRGWDLPPASRALELRVGAAPISFEAVLRATRGTFRTIQLGTADPASPTLLRRTVPADGAGGRVVSLTIVPPPRLIEGGADAGHALRGHVRLSGPLGAAVSTWEGEGGVTVRPRPGGADLAYVITPNRTARVHPRQPTELRPPAVLVTPRLAELAGGVGGGLPLRLGGERVPVRVAGVVQRFPGTRGEAVVGDVAALSSAVDARVPGAGRPDEVWLDVPPRSASLVTERLARPPFNALESVSRRALIEEARRDPIGRGTLLALAAAAIVALTLAVLGLVLAVRAELRDEAGDLYALESQGASPSLLRRVVRVRALATALAGAVVGMAAGGVLALLVTKVVSVTARATAPEPPLQVALDPTVLVAGAVVFLGASALLVLGATHAIFRGERGPTRAVELGE